jgi:hypothetical protein
MARADGGAEVAAPLGRGRTQRRRGSGTARKNHSHAGAEQANRENYQRASDTPASPGVSAEVIGIANHAFSSCWNDERKDFGAASDDSCGSRTAAPRGCHTMLAVPAHPHQYFRKYSKPAVGDDGRPKGL